MPAQPNGISDLNHSAGEHAATHSGAPIGLQSVAQPVLLDIHHTARWILARYLASTSLFHYLSADENERSGFVDDQRASKDLRCETLDQLAVRNGWD
jgi:hypothetical protein